MRYKKVATSVMSVALAASMIVPAQAAQDQGVVKTETVYVKADKTGNVKETIVSDWLQNASGSKTIEDTSTLNNIKNVKGDESFKTGKKNSVKWNANGKDIYYQGTTDQETPVQLKATYYLDGKETDPEKLDGKSGELKIKLTSTNSTDTAFTVMSMLTIPTEQCSNVSVTNGKVISDGKNEIVVGVMMPGLIDQLDLDDYNGDDYASVTIKCDIKDFEPVSIYNIAMNGLLNDINLDDTDELTDMLDELKDSSEKLVDGSKELSDGMSTLSDKAKEYTDGIAEYIKGVNKYTTGVSKVSSGLNKLAAGGNTLVKGSDDLATGAKKVDAGAGELASNMPTIAAGAKSVSDGAGALYAGLKQVQDQLSAQPDSLDLGVSEAQLNGLMNGLSQLKELSSTAEDLGKLIQAQQQVIATTKDENAKAVLEKTVAAEQQLLSKIAGMSSIVEQANSLAPKLQQLPQLANTYSTSMKQLKGGIAQLTKGAETLSSGSKSLAAGAATASKGSKTLKEGTKTLADGAKAISSGASTLNSGLGEAKKGTDQLTANNKALTENGEKINSASGAVKEGIGELEEGSKTLADGMFKFNEEGIKKGTDTASDLFDKMDDLIDKDADYKNFSGISKDMEGEVKFVIELQ
ncbi:MAG: hypothetical protein Q4D45_07750 [Lachnospiraceae bacterium]|nr:hypothetical protein [Lachnospiraceae bacterium]